MSPRAPKVEKKKGTLDLPVPMLHLKAADRILYTAALPHYPELLLRKGHRRGYAPDDLFATLAGSVVSQQLSTKAADTIWGRLKDACGGSVTPEAVRKLRLPTMRKCGLSAAKAKTLKELARAILAGELDLPALRKMSEEEAIIKLSAVWGIGRWTAEMFLMFALELPDVFSPKDLGLMRAMEGLYGIPANSKPEVYHSHALRWSPYRTFASRVLWKLRDSK